MGITQGQQLLRCSSGLCAPTGSASVLLSWGLYTGEGSWLLQQQHCVALEMLAGSGTAVDSSPEHPDWEGLGWHPTGCA